MRLLRYGEDGWLVEPDDPADVLPLAFALRAVDGITETVPAARTVLVRVADPARGDGWVRAQVESVPVVRTGVASEGAAVTLDVRYDGSDLADTAAELGLDADGLVRAHAAGEYVVAFCGFVPGFAYLSGLDPTLHAPRLAEPRTRVPAGSVGIAVEFTGVYPRVSPGGWRLLGTTDAALWDTRRDPPAMLAPGTRVRFRAVG